jgi:UDP-glucose 6-dehydrogenase
MNIKEKFFEVISKITDNQEDKIEKKDTLLIGFGTVGQVIEDGFNYESNSQLYIYDPVLKNCALPNRSLFFNIENIQNLYGFETIIICVPTGDNKNFNSDEIIKTLDKLKELKYTGLVIIKSTCDYDIIKTYINDLKIIYWAEFLNNISALEDFYNEKEILIGGPSYLQKEVQDYIFEFFPHITTINFRDLKTAMYFKLFKNADQYIKVMFWNMINNNNFDLDQRDLKELFELYPNKAFAPILGQDGKLGVGGKCLPKDFQLLGQKFENKTVKQIFDKYQDFNSYLRSI